MLKIPPRDPKKMMKPNPIDSQGLTEDELLEWLFNIVFEQNKEMLEELAKY
jgi:hypothetical protein